MGRRRAPKASIFTRRPLPSAVRLGLPFARIVLLAGAGVVGSAFALARGWSYQPKPMFVERARAVPVTTSTQSEDSLTEVEIDTAIENAKADLRP